MHNFTMNEYQADAAATAIYKHKIIYCMLGLQSEVGEVSGKLKKLMRDGGVRFDGDNSLSDKQIADLGAELGDVLWYVSNLSRDLGLSLNDVATMNLEKLQSRQERGVLGGSGDNR